MYSPLLSKRTTRMFSTSTSPYPSLLLLCHFRLNFSISTSFGRRSPSSSFLLHVVRCLATERAVRELRIITWGHLLSFPPCRKPPPRPSMTTYPIHLLSSFSIQIPRAPILLLTHHACSPIISDPSSSFIHIAHLIPILAPSFLLSTIP